jgi:hypothetical protein
MAVPLPCLRQTFSGNESLCPLVNTPQLNPQLNSPTTIAPSLLSPPCRARRNCQPSTELLVASTVLKVTPRHGPHGKHFSVVKNACLLARYSAMDICEPHRKHLLRHGSIVAFTAPSHSNGSYPIVACVFVAAGMCLPSRCLETGVHVTL